jgi:hypothetical protein
LRKQRAVPAAQRRSYKLTIRSRSRARSQRFATLDAALDALEERGRELERDADEPARGGTFIRRLQPVQIVVGRLEIAGPRRLRAGIDVRGDGSSEAFTGRFRRRVVEQRAGESSYEALRRELS